MRKKAKRGATSSRPARSQPESFRGRELTAALTVRDLGASVAFYRDALGFTVGENYSRDDRLIAVQVKAGAVQFLLNQDDGALGFDRSKGEGLSLQIITAQDVDALAARAIGAGAQLVTPPSTTPWGARVFRVRDPDGFRLVISSVRPS